MDNLDILKKVVSVEGRRSLGINRWNSLWILIL